MSTIHLLPMAKLALGLIWVMHLTTPALATTADDRECVTTPPRLHERQLLKQPDVQAVSVSHNGLRASLLLRNGQSIYVRHFGCEHITLEASTWVEQLAPTPEKRIQQAQALARRAFSKPWFKPIPISFQDFDETSTEGTSERPSLLRYLHHSQDLEVLYTLQVNGVYLLTVSYTLAQ